MIAITVKKANGKTAVQFPTDPERMVQHYVRMNPRATLLTIHVLLRQ